MLALLLIGGCAAQGTRIVTLASGDCRIESPLYTMKIPTTLDWKIDPLEGSDTVWLSKYNSAGKLLSLNLVVMEFTPEQALEHPDDIVDDTFAEYEKLGREGGMFGGMVIEDVRSESLEIAGKTWHRMVYTALARQEVRAYWNHGAGVYFHIPVAEGPARYLLINLKDEGSVEIDGNWLLELELPNILRTLRIRGEGWAMTSVGT
jgi:hypothetical protein